MTYYYLKEQRRHVARFLAVLLGICFLLLCVATASPASAAASRGWIEAKAEVPDGFEQNIVLSLVHEETGESFGYQLLKENGYVVRDQLPLGDYFVDAVFVYQNYSFTVTTDVTSFSVTEYAAAPINIVVEPVEASDPLPTGTPAVSESPTESPSDSPSAAPETSAPGTSEPVSSEAPTPSEPSDEQDPNSSSSVGDFIGRVLFVLFGTAIFVGIVFLIVYLARRHMNNE